MHFLLKKYTLRAELKTHIIVFVILVSFINIYVRYQIEDFLFIFDITYKLSPEDTADRVYSRLNSLYFFGGLFILGYIFDRFYILIFGSVLIALLSRLVGDLVYRLRFDWGVYSEYDLMVWGFLFWQMNIFLILRLLLVWFASRALYKSLSAYRNC
jgi:hypothetical protein